MVEFFAQAEDLYKNKRYEEALTAYEEAIRVAGSHPDPRLYYGKAAVRERLAQQAYEIAKQGGYKEEKQIEATDDPVVSLDQMSSTSLAARCLREINKSRLGEPSTETYGLELIRRATVQGDPEAWALMQHCFSGLVFGWLRSHPNREAACRLENEENYVAQAFERFWQATTSSQKIEFRTLAVAFRYLRLSLNSVILDTLRMHARSKEESLPEPNKIEDDYKTHGLWEFVNGLLPNERERRLAYLLYRCELKPREIVRFSSDEFSDINEIYRLRQSISERLLRNADQLRWRLS
jgi:hypothetical protein